ncbi:flagellar basal-body MS-ring/collar protein FliF [Candidatus Caldatribacterium saccharofermentans]|uniref:Flagellar M-ring protein n=1 Tax=Candidatus Caldatribacterium saccharofermentans TaxID=1454753 RepID=A0A7V4TH33_9BACT
MRSPLADFTEQVKNVWGGMTQPQRVLFLLVSTALFAGLITLFLYSGKPDYAPLFRSTDPQETGRVVDALAELGIPHRLSSGGTVVEVPQDRLHEARMKLAQKGFPTRGTGFEVFDRNTFGLTSFLQRVNYQRALQGELERTIMQLAEVEAARVHVVLPEERLFAEDRKEPTASVVLRLRPGATLREEQIEAIAHLVANSVEGLDPQRVAIVDDRGNILATGTKEGTTLLGLANLTAAQIEVKREVEEVLTRRIQTMLESVLGREQAVVRVSADVNFERREGEKEVFEPVLEGEGIVRSTKETEERYEGTATPPGGAAGVASNIPVYGEREERGTQSTYNRRESTVNYEVNRILERFSSSPGRIERLSVAVLVDSTLPPEAVEKVRSVVQAAAGIDFSRGDTLIVEALPFNRAMWEEERRALAAQKFADLLELLLKYGVVAFLALLFYILGRRILVAATTPPQEVVAEFYEAEEAPEEEVTELPSVRPPELTPEERMRLELQRQMEEEIQKLVQTSPANVAKLIRNWLSEE